MTSVRIDASEVHALADDLRRAADEMPGKAELAVSKVGHDVQATWEALVPVDTGFLKSSGSLDIVGLGFDFGPTADYGVYVELGTSEMNPEPALGPAYDQHLANLERALGQLGVQGIA